MSSKLRPHAINSTLSLLLINPLLNYTKCDKKVDDYLINNDLDTQEPISIKYDTFIPTNLPHTKLDKPCCSDFLWNQ